MDDISILFDLDGTLLPMDYDRFTKAYFKELCRWMEPLGYESSELVSAVWSGVQAILAGDPNTTNEERFWTEFARVLGPRVYQHRKTLNHFYVTDFNKVSMMTSRTPHARRVVDLARMRAGETGKLVLATNPIFPRSAVESRLNWAGLELSDFDYVTTYENCCFCKPDPRYYTELTNKLMLDPARCMMIGNDVGEDMIPARSVGMKTMLVTDCLIGDPAEVPGIPNVTLDTLAL